MGFARHVANCCPDLLQGDGEERLQLVRGGAEALELIHELHSREAAVRARVKSAAFSADGVSAPVVGLQRSWSDAAKLVGLPVPRVRRAARATIEHVKLIVDRDCPVDVVWETDGALAVNKPSGVRSVPMHRFEGSSVLNRVLGYVQSSSGNPDAWAWSVHRLDVETSGVLLFAKSRAMAGRLAGAFQNRTARKTYMALGMRSRDDAKTDEWVVDAPLGPAPGARHAAVQCVTAAGKPSSTHFRVLFKSPDGTHALILCSPLSGRRHQIRVHLQHSGWPIVGDATYHTRDAPRLMLHAYALRIPDPDVQCRAPVPSVFRDVCVSKGVHVTDWSPSLPPRSTVATAPPAAPSETDA